MQDATAEIEMLEAKALVISRRIGRPGPENPAPPTKTRRLWRKRAAAETRKHDEEWAILDAVDDLLGNAQRAAKGTCPEYKRLRSWWTGNCTEAAFRNIHNAEAMLAQVYNDRAVRAEIPEAVRRARESLTLDNPMRETARRCLESLRRGPLVSSVELSKVIEAGHSAADRQRLKLRTFRNIMLIGFAASVILLLALIVIMSIKPELVPLCFVKTAEPKVEDPNIICPVNSLYSLDSSSFHGLPSRWDFFIVATLGLTGGALSAALFIRDLHSNATPYNVSVPLALLKLPAGGLTALVGIILLAGEFVPGFSAIDKSVQILAYALLFGFAQQIFTQVLDQRAQRLVNNIPTKARSNAAAGSDQPAGSADGRAY
ncbi:hypothetical protein [Paractinoplanes atraurantiacus]|uniref:hypothetical protein n=1 Tax=Paractinoplanes atraurantiacus TaxID=1036182 RepID=UPI0011788DAC|nr:hypothetical protein [Actinoplanes atraurantiacus]